jgi:hypothetical protein
MPAGRMPKQGDAGERLFDALGGGLHGLRQALVAAPAATHSSSR